MELIYLAEHDPRYYVMVDSNLFLHHLEELEAVRTQLLSLIGNERKMILIVPYTVHAELERMKKSNRIPEALQKQGRDALDEIEELTKLGLAVGQDSYDAEKTYKDWYSYPIVTNDDRILHCALCFKYRYGKNNVGVLSQDRGMRVNARSMKIITFHIQEPEKTKSVKRSMMLKPESAPKKPKQRKLFLESTEKTAVPGPSKVTRKGKGPIKPKQQNLSPGSSEMPAVPGHSMVTGKGKGPMKPKQQNLSPGSSEMPAVPGHSMVTGKGNEPKTTNQEKLCGASGGELSSANLLSQETAASISPKSGVEKVPASLLSICSHITNLRESLQISLALELDKTTRAVIVQCVKLLLKFIDTIHDQYVKAMNDANTIESDASDALYATLVLYCDHYNVKDLYVARRTLDKFFSKEVHRPLAEEVLAQLVKVQSSSEEVRRLVTYLDSQ